ncbi:MAG: hypothetical protein AOA66_0869 [Candidatus Bathyarchaeota archaeon BA2]|nr:MAG: hypothetical protein AOA66_0869 [Candidatus Bathyarchaeota archaeon BA2]
MEVLATIWLEGCEFPKPEEVEGHPKEKVPMMVASAGSS